MFGKNRFDTEFSSALNGRGICKAGGEAVRGIVLKTKKYGLTGIAIKTIYSIESPQGGGHHRPLFGDQRVGV